MSIRKAYTSFASLVLACCLPTAGPGAATNLLSDPAFAGISSSEPFLPDWVRIDFAASFQPGQLVVEEGTAAVITAVNWLGASKNDPYCVGFFDNNEIRWGEDPLEVVRDIIEDCDAGVAAKVELVRFLQDDYGSMASANAAWGSSFAAWNDLLPALGNNAFTYTGADRSLVAFYAHLADTYYRRCREAIQTVAPHKLYLGSRIHDNAMRKEVAAAAARHCDVVSFNICQKDLDAFQGPTVRDLPFFPDDKPFLVGEFNVGALDRGKFFTGTGFAADQRDRGENYVRYIESALDNPRCIGAHWFNYVDQPTGGKHRGSENTNSGLIDLADGPYPELVEAVRSMGPRLYDYRYRVPIVVPGPAELNIAQGPDQVELSWPMESLGWRLEVQTNWTGAIDSGDWTSLPGADITNRMSVPLSSEATPVLFRLANP